LIPANTSSNFERNVRYHKCKKLHQGYLHQIYADKNIQYTIS